jgi:hypothetical protein
MRIIENPAKEKAEAAREGCAKAEGDCRCMLCFQSEGGNR